MTMPTENELRALAAKWRKRADESSASKYPVPGYAAHYRSCADALDALADRQDSAGARANNGDHKTIVPTPPPGKYAELMEKTAASLRKRAEKAEAEAAALRQRVEAAEGAIGDAAEVERLIRIVKCRVGEAWPSGDAEAALAYALEWAERLRAALADDAKKETK